MAVIRKKTVGTKPYYYLEHTFRLDGKVLKKEKYIGTVLPKNINELKRKFLEEFYHERWHSKLDAIRQNYKKDSKLMPPSSVQEELKKFVIRFTYDTQKIEGSKLTLRETANLLERGVTPKDKPVADVKEAEAHNTLFLKMFATDKELTLALVLDWHRQLLKDTKSDIAGRLREHQVAISGSKFMPPAPVEVYPMITEFFKWYSKNRKKVHPVELAALVHLKFVTIHPFGDGNGRMSRLMMNFVLKKFGFPMLNVPYEGRNSYYTALERSQTKNVDEIFVQWFIKKYLKEYQKLI